MVKMYDIVIMKKSGKHAAIIEIDDDKGTKQPIYLVEIIDEEKPEDAKVEEVVFWCEREDFTEDNAKGR